MMFLHMGHDCCVHKLRHNLPFEMYVTSVTLWTFLCKGLFINQKNCAAILNFPPRD